MNNERIYFLGGTTLSCTYSLFQPELLKTVILAIVGTLTSYACSKLLAVLKKRYDDKKEN